ncbi:MAG: WecB/TagA/CpsF family glycosyltransferase [Cyanobacteria bacterium P01_D01_bin.156]
MEARFNDGLQRALTKADMVTPDGMPLVWVMRFLGRTAQDRVAGMDIFTAVCKQSVQENVSIYLLGATQDVLDKVVAKLRVDFPTLNVAGFESPPFRKWTFLEEEAIAERVNQSGAGITFVSLGCPKQECWMESNHGRVKSVMIGVGGVFPVYAGNKKHAPGWMRNNGLEWLYRLAQEPQRLFKRYFTTIPPFIWLAFQQIRQEQKRRGFLQN